MSPEGLVEQLPKGLRARLSQLFPHARVVATEVLGPDAHLAAESGKQIGYGRPIRVGLLEADGARHDVVFHTASANDFGHDRRADRAEGMVLAWDTFGQIPRQTPALDVGAIGDDGLLVTLARTGEFYLLSRWCEGRVYAEDLRALGARGPAAALDLERTEALARYLVDLHRMPGTRPPAYTRAIRDLLGHGEGIFGLVDSYPDEVPGAPRERLEALERACLSWRWRLKGRVERLRRTHGDFHPFNIVFRQGADFSVLDTSRGSQGDPADDVAALSINYLFFGLEHPATFAVGLGRLFERFFEVYLSAGGDAGVLEALAPFYAWRALVLASPLWYPHLTVADRERILGFAERALAAPRFDPAWGRALLS